MRPPVEGEIAAVRKPSKSIVGSNDVEGLYAIREVNGGQEYENRQDDLYVETAQLTVTRLCKEWLGL